MTFVELISCVAISLSFLKIVVLVAIDILSFELIIANVLEFIIANQQQAIVD